MSGPSLPGAWLERIARALCEADAAERLLLPIVADLQFEWSQASTARERLWVRLRAGSAFARVLVPAFFRMSAEEGDLARRLAAWIALATLAATAVLMMAWPPPVKMPATLEHPLLLLLPSMLCVSLPAGCLFGVLACGIGRRGWRPLLAPAAAATLLTLAVTSVLMPRANQAYREQVYAALVPSATTGPIPGDRELTLSELALRVSELRRAEDELAASRTALEWHKRLTLSALCVALALAGAALARIVPRVWLRLPLGLVLLNLVFFLLRLGEQLGDAGRVPAALAMWGPVAMVLTLSAMLTLAKRERRRATVA